MGGIAKRELEMSPIELSKSGAIIHSWLPSQHIIIQGKQIVIEEHGNFFFS
jgi:hypothetical protein